MSLNKLSTAMIAATGTASSQTFLRGDGAWADATVGGLDFGYITALSTNVLTLILQIIPVDFNEPTLSFDAGTI